MENVNGVIGTVDISGGTVTVSSLPSISGTVTANIGNYSSAITGYAGGASSVTAMPVVITDKGIYGGSVLGYNGTNTYLNVGIQSVGATSLNSASGLPITLPNGAVTTRFGSVTTAGVVQATSAVTNANRKYLLIQNPSTSAVTIGIGFTPTTTQGIVLYSGGGLTFDSFVPTGAVYWLSSVTNSNIIAIEA
jgi:hypothetical protein